MGISLIRYREIGAMKKPSKKKAVLIGGIAGVVLLTAGGCYLGIKGTDLSGSASNEQEIAVSSNASNDKDADSASSLGLKVDTTTGYGSKTIFPW